MGEPDWMDFGDFPADDELQASAANSNKRKGPEPASMQQKRREREAKASEVRSPRDYVEEERLKAEGNELYDQRYTHYVEGVHEQYALQQEIAAPDFVRRYTEVMTYVNERAGGVIAARESHIFLEELCINPEVYARWHKIFAEQDREYLRGWSEGKLRELQQLVKAKREAIRKTRSLPKVTYDHHATEAFARMQFHPIHGSTQVGLQGEIISANKVEERTGKKPTLQTGSGDAFIDGANFVYAGFAESPHPFSGSKFYGTPDQVTYGYGKPDEIIDPIDTVKPWVNSEDDLNLRENTYLLDESTFIDADIAMFDIHFTRIGPKSGQAGYMEAYLNNYFDYETGKEILRTYLEYVFDDPAEALAFMNRVGSEIFFENFYKEIPNFESIPAGFPRERVIEIRKTMQEVFRQTGIAPPLMSEIRIKDKAKIISALPDSAIEPIE